MGFIMVYKPTYIWGAPSCSSYPYFLSDEMPQILEPSPVSGSFLARLRRFQPADENPISLSSCQEDFLGEASQFDDDL